MTTLDEIEKRLHHPILQADAEHLLRIARAAENFVSGIAQRGRTGGPGLVALIQALEASNDQDA